MVPNVCDLGICISQYSHFFENKKDRETPHVSDVSDGLLIKWRVLMDELTQGGRAGMADDVPREFAHIYPD